MINTIFKFSSLKVKFYALTAFIFILSCQQDSMAPVDDFSIDEAKSWYENQKFSPLRLKSGKNGLEIRTDWIKHKLISYDSISLFEIPITSKGKFGFVSESAKQAKMRTQNFKYFTSLSKLIIKKSRKSKSIEAFVMTIVPSAEYLENAQFDLRNISYLKKDPKFTGYILYHLPNGSFVNGWQYDNGEVTKIIRATSSSDSHVRLKNAPECQVINVGYWQQDCIDWYQNGEHIYGECGEPYFVVDYSYISCPSEGGGGGGYTPPSGGGSGSSGGGSGSGSSGSGSSGSNNPFEIKDNFEDHPCGSNALEAVVETNPSVLSNILRSVFGVSDKVNVTFTAGNLPADVDGQFDGSPVSYVDNYHVTINTLVLDSATQPYIAATLLHEGLHAYFQYLSDHDGTFRSRFPFLDTNANGDLIYITDEQDREHEYMTRYVGEIADALKSAYPQLTQNTALALSWGGLQRTRAYKLNKERLDQIVPNNFSNGVIITNQVHRTGGCNNLYIYQL